MVENNDNKKEISKLLKERTELLFIWNLEYSKGKGSTQEAREILDKKNCKSKRIEELGGDFNNISEELFNEVKQEFLNKRLDRIDRDLAKEITYDDLGKERKLCGGI